jgi:hypothetical protein
MYHAIVFLPLIGFLIAGLFGRSLIGAKASESSHRGLPDCCRGRAVWIAFFIEIGFGDAGLDAYPGADAGSTSGDFRSTGRSASTR